MSGRRERGFTLVEVVLAMTLLATMMLLLYSGLGFALRSWDAAEANGRRFADRRVAQNFLRREIAELFPMRWKDPMEVKVAFDGQPDALRFVSSRAPGIQLGGLALVGLTVEEGRERGTRDLVMRRAMPDDAAVDFGPLEQGEPHVILEGVESVQFRYFGAENDFSEPQWHDAWKFPARVPQMVRMTVRVADGTVLPDMVVRVMLGEEAGCLENSFQRLCRPRRPT